MLGDNRWDLIKLKMTGESVGIAALGRSSSDAFSSSP